MSPSLRHLEIHPTLSCNLRCGFCGLRRIGADTRVGDLVRPADATARGPAGTRLAEAPETRVREHVRRHRPSLTSLLGAVREAARLGAAGLTLSGGGEPLASPRRTLALLHAARDAGLRTNLVSNGTLVDEDTADRLGSAGLDRFTWSLLGADANYHDEAAGRPRAFERARRGLGALARLTDAPALALHVPLTAAVSRRLSDIVRLAVDLGADVLWGLPLKGFPPTTAILDERAADLADAGGLVHNLRHVGRPPPAEATCAQPWDTLVLHADGTATPCCSMVWGCGDVLTSGLESVWGGRWLSDLRAELSAGRDPAACRGCLDRSGATERRLASAPGSAR